MTDRESFIRYPATSPAAARRYVQSVLLAFDRAEAVEDAILLVSELVTNVLVHTGSEHASIGVIATETGIRIEVDDHSPAPPVREKHPDLSVPGGLGLGIVEDVSARWGVLQHPDNGKTVWFELELELATG